MALFLACCLSVILNGVKMDEESVVEKMFLAVCAGKLDEVKKLVDANTGIELELSLTGKTWVHDAASKSHWQLMEYFVELGVPINQKTRNGKCVLGTVADQGNLEKVKWLIEKGADVSNDKQLIVSAIYGGNIDIVSLFLENGVEYEFTFGADDRTPLSFAKMMGHEAIAKLLEAKGAKTEMAEEATEGNDKDLARREEIIGCIRHHTDTEPNKKTLAELLPGKVAIQIHSVQTDENVILFTSGMSFEAMNVEKGSEELKHAELVMYLPKDWPINPAKDSPHFWPYQWLRTIAHYPHENDTWLGGPLSTFNNDEPPKPLGKGVEFTSFLLAHGFGFPAFRADDGRTVNLITVTPIYSEESKLAKEKGFMELGERLEANEVTSMALPGRINVAVPLKSKN